MIRRSCRLLQAFALSSCVAGGAAADARNMDLQPYQMVRSLQLVQDRIAGGDHASLPMQNKLLEMIDTRFRSSSQEDFSDERNIRALLVYAMSGGNPSTVASRLGRLELPDMDRTAGDAVLAYLLGDAVQARTALASIDPTRYANDVAAFLSLIMGSVLAGDRYDEALSHLDRARLLGPGTLVEEAALRRTVALAVAKGDGERFIAASEQYARRFLRSPYAAQFAEAFVEGTINLRETLNLTRFEQTVDWMTGEQARTIYLRLSRQAAIDGDAELLAFATDRVKKYPVGRDGMRDARAELYSTLSSVTSTTVTETLDRLEGLNNAGLSVKDRALLEAAKTVAHEVVAPVSPQSLPATARPATDADEAAIDRGLIESTRARLEEIDKLLEESGR